MRKEADFRAKFPPVVASGMSAMSECERLLPTLEVVLGCLLEAAAAASISDPWRATLSGTISSIVCAKSTNQLCAYHPTPVTFLLRLFATYHGCSALTAQLKLDLVRTVLARADGNDDLLQFFSAGPPPKRSTAEHLQVALQRAAAASARGPSAAEAGGWPCWDEAMFGEFGSRAEAAEPMLTLEALRAPADWEVRALDQPSQRFGCADVDWLQESGTPGQVLRALLDAAVRPAADGAAAGAEEMAGAVMARLPLEMQAPLVPQVLDLCVSR